MRKTLLQTLLAAFCAILAHGSSFAVEGGGVMQISSRNTIILGDRLPYDREVEYLESNGAQYINTGIALRYDVRIKTEVLIRSIASSGTSHFIGGRNVSQGGAGYGVSTVSGKLTSDYFGSRVSVKTAQTDVWYAFDKDKNLFRIDGTTYTHTASSSVIDDYNIRLFGFDANANAGSYGGVVRMKAVQMWQGENLVRDLIPVRRRIDGVSVGEMYDRVSRTFAERHGTFVIGPDKPLAANS